MWRDGGMELLLLIFRLLFFEPYRFPDIDVGICEVELGIDIAQDSLVRLHNLLEFDFHEEIERIDVLFDQALDPQESWKEIPFVLQGCHYDYSLAFD